MVPLHVPPLREHAEDVPELLSYYVDWFSTHEKLPYRHFSMAAQNFLRHHSWHGNVRELKNLVERLAIMTESEFIDEANIPDSYKHKGPMLSGDGMLEVDSLKKAKREFKKAYILRKLSENENNISQTADSIGIERSHLHKKIKSFGLKL